MLDNHINIKDQIIIIAKDKYKNMCYPVRTNRVLPRAFRVVESIKPFGFCFARAAIEVHVTNHTLLILGIREDGTAKTIAEGVQV